MRKVMLLCIHLVTAVLLVHSEGYRIRQDGIRHGLERFQLNARTVVSEALPLTPTEVEKLEKEHVGFEAEEPKPPKCPLMAHHISNRIVKAIVEHDMTMLCDRDVDASGRPKHMQQKWKIKQNRKRLSPVLFRVGEKLKGRVAVTFPTYALVDVGSTSYGVLHARDMSEGWIDRVDHSISSGDDLVVIVKSIDEDGRYIRLTLLDLPKLESTTGEPLERRPIHSYKVEEVVSGVIRRRSPLGYYIDIGATVDGFLHINDRKLPRRYTGISRQPFRIGTHVPTLYVKSIDLIKNWIQLSENCISEEMEKRCMTAQETPEQQAIYNSDAHLSMSQKMGIMDLERMRMIGGYDQLLEEVGGDRNSTPEYIMYLKNRKLREELLKRRDSLHDDADNMTEAEFNKATKEFNKLSMQIAELDEEAMEPPPFERTVYKYGQPGVWESRVYTPLDEKNPSGYFEKVAKEVTSALRDVQGENFDFKGSMEEDLINAERRAEFLDMLWSRFHQAPSTLSKIEDTEPRQPLLEDIEGLMPASLVSNNKGTPSSTDPDAETVLSTLDSYDDPEAAELAQMIRGASGFNPLEQSPMLIDDDETAMSGACAMVDDDVTQWKEQFEELYEDAGVDPVQVATSTLAGKDLSYDKDKHSQIEDILTDNAARESDSRLPSLNVDYAVDSTHGAQNEENFVSPTVEGDHSEEEDYGNDIEGGTEYDAEQDGTDFEESNDDEDTDDYKNLAEEIFGKRERVTFKNGMSSESASAKTITVQPHRRLEPRNEELDGKTDPSASYPQGPLEPEETLYRPKTLADDVREIMEEVKQLTDEECSKTSVDTVPPSSPFENCDTKKIRYEMYMQQQRYMDRATRVYMMSKIPARPLPSEEEASSDDEYSDDEDEAMSSIWDSDVGDLGTEEGTPEVLNEDFTFSDDEQNSDQRTPTQKLDPAALKELKSLAKSMVNSDQRRRTLVRIARKHLPPEVVAKYQFDNKDPEYMEEIATILRQGKPLPKLRPYTYYPEGIDKAGLGEDRRSINRRVRDANLKLAKLKRNKRFLHMLDRLGVDPQELTFENLHLLLPRELKTERPPPYRRLVGMGESNLPENKG